VAAEELAADVGVKAACAALGVARSTLYRRRRPKTDAARGPRATPERALKPEERTVVLETLHSERFVNRAPAEAWATLLDEGTYLCSERTMYRILDDAQEVRERRDQLRHPPYAKPELLARGPNEVWSWDITKLKEPAKWVYYYLYVLLDIFSRYVVGWMVAERESAVLAKRLIATACDNQGIGGEELTVHADRGQVMRSKEVVQLLADLGITRTHTRPYTSSDNPFSESHFKTLKYGPDFPDRFGSPEHAVGFGREFFAWYNTEHRHSGIGYLTPEAVHYGEAERMLEHRRQVLDRAFRAHPERFVNGRPTPPELPEAVWINKPAQRSTAQETELVESPESDDLEAPRGRGTPGSGTIWVPGQPLDPTIAREARTRREASPTESSLNEVVQLSHRR
jgi:putative transposase